MGPPSYPNDGISMCYGDSHFRKAFENHEGVICDPLRSTEIHWNRDDSVDRGFMLAHLRSPTPVWAWEVTGAWKKAADSFSVSWVLENCHEKDGYESTDQYFLLAYSP